jgi:phage terminase Nu1 subunit (DNA packaging protein)
MNKLLTAKQVAEIICCSEKTIYSWAETGYAGIPVIKFGEGKKSLLRFDREKIMEWIRRWEDRPRGTDF